MLKIHQHRKKKRKIHIKMVKVLSLCGKIIRHSIFLMIFFSEFLQ